MAYATHTKVWVTQIVLFVSIRFHLCILSFSANRPGLDPHRGASQPRSASKGLVVRSGILQFILDLTDLGEEVLEWGVFRVFKKELRQS